MTAFPPLSLGTGPSPHRPSLSLTASFREVSRAFLEESHEFLYVSADGQTLEGVITMTDLIRAQSTGLTGDTPASEFMARNPVALATEDNGAVAAEALREYRLKSLPVVEDKQSRRLAGCLRARRLLAHVSRELGQDGPGTDRHEGPQ